MRWTPDRRQAGEADARPETCAHGGGSARPHRPRTGRTGPTEFFGELLRKLVPKPLVMPLAQEIDVRALLCQQALPRSRSRACADAQGLTFPISDYAPFEYAITTAIWRAALRGGESLCDESL